MNAPAFRASTPLIVTAFLVAGAAFGGCGSSKSNSSTPTSSSGVPTSASAPATSASSSGSPSSTKVTTTAGNCPSAAALGAAAGVTYTAPHSTPGYQAGWVACQYNQGSQVALLVSLYPSGTSLQTVSTNAAGSTTPVSGIGDSASYYDTLVYVSRSSAPSFSVSDETGTLTLAQVESVARAIVAG